MLKMQSEAFFILICPPFNLSRGKFSLYCPKKKHLTFWKEIKKKKMIYELVYIIRKELELSLILETFVLSAMKYIFIHSGGQSYSCKVTPLHN
jgi:hypothetical protein